MSISPSPTQTAYGFPVVVLRFFGSYGPRQPLSWWGGPPPVFIDAVLNDKVIPIHGDGQQTRSFTYVTDTIDGIYAAMMRDEANGRVLNIGNDEEVTILDLAQTHQGGQRHRGRAEVRAGALRVLHGQELRGRAPAGAGHDARAARARRSRAASASTRVCGARSPGKSRPLRDRRFGTQDAMRGDAHRHHRRRPDGNGARRSA